MEVTPRSSNSWVSFSSAARWRYVNSSNPSCMRPYSSAMGSLTLRIISEESHTSSADGTIFAPTAAYSSSLIAEPTPAPCCTRTSWPWPTRAFTPAGVAATRNSLFLTSVGIPTFMRMSFFLDDSPPTTLSAGLTTVATVTTRVHGCVGTHLFKVALPTEPRKSSLLGRPRMPHTASSRPHDSRNQHMRPPLCPWFAVDQGSRTS